MGLLKNEPSALSIYHLSSLLVIEASPEWSSDPPIPPIPSSIRPDVFSPAFRFAL